MMTFYEVESFIEQMQSCLQDAHKMLVVPPEGMQSCPCEEEKKLPFDMLLKVIIGFAAKNKRLMVFYGKVSDIRTFP